jgi:hypothetical protein
VSKYDESTTGLLDHVFLMPVKDEVGPIFHISVTFIILTLYMYKICSKLFVTSFALCPNVSLSVCY